MIGFVTGQKVMWVPHGLLGNERFRSSSPRDKKTWLAHNIQDKSILLDRYFSNSEMIKTAATSASVEASSWPSSKARQTAFGTTPREQFDEPAPVRNGKLPSWLNGCFYRNGPGTFENGTDEGMLHLFDGYGMVVKVDIAGKTNDAAISNVFVKSNAYNEFKNNSKMKWREFGTPKPVDGLGEKIADVVSTILGSIGIGQGTTDNASVHIIPRGEHLWAMTETVDGTFVIDRDTLETKGRVVFNDDLNGTLTTAHPLVLTNDKLINLLSIPGMGFEVFSCDASNKRKKVAYIPHVRPMSPSWIHDFPGNEEFVVIPEMPFYFNLASLMLGTTGTHLFLDWIPEDKTRLHVIEISSGTVHTVCADPFFVFHWANAFSSDDGRYLHLDATVYDNPDIVEHLLLKNIRNGDDELPKSYLRRLTLEKLQDGSFSLIPAADGSNWHKLSNDETRDFGDFTDFPTVATTARGKRHRYVWMSAAVRPTNVTNALVKFDTKTSSSICWHEPGALPGEPCFVPAPNGLNEDDGVILSMLTEASGDSSLLVLDARDLKEHCRISCNVPISSGFHGSFVPTKV